MLYPNESLFGYVRSTEHLLCCCVIIIGGSNHESIFLSTVGSIRTDFNEGDSYQKVVRFGYDGSRLVTGGCDGVLRVWKV